MFLDALKNEDGYAIINCMSAEEIEFVNSFIEAATNTPDEVFAELALMDIEVTAEELVNAFENMTAVDFVLLFLTSEDYKLIFSSMEIEVGEAIIDGDTAIVRFTTGGHIEKILLFIEDDGWKIPNILDFTM